MRFRPEYCGFTNLSVAMYEEACRAISARKMVLARQGGEWLSRNCKSALQEHSHGLSSPAILRLVNPHATLTQCYVSNLPSKQQESAFAPICYWFCERVVGYSTY